MTWAEDECNWKRSGVGERLNYPPMTSWLDRGRRGNAWIMEQGTVGYKTILGTYFRESVHTRVGQSAADT
jgi:hypothetical protein